MVVRSALTNLRQLKTRASNGHAELIMPAVLKKEDEPKTKVARA